MEIPSGLESTASNREDVTITRREYEDESAVAVDFGPGAGDATVDGTALVVEEDLFEFDVPSDADEVTADDAIVTRRE